ncbi:PMCA-type calcium-translocating P-type ATPase [Pilobolus umbonatus]|nr:PMCA-type calcium-translocating P-type ATPase [Pilobolus umbonatus]
MPPQFKDDMSTSKSSLLSFSTQKRKGFPLTIEQLNQLIDCPDLISQYGGTHGICQSLEVDPAYGLMPDESFNPCYGIVPNKNQEPFEERKSVYGKNELPKAPIKSFLSLIITGFNDQTLIMLTVAAIISLMIGIYDDNSPNHPVDEPKIGWVDGAAIIVAVIVVLITNAINDYEKEKQFRKLNSKKEDRLIEVLRAGVTQQIHIQELVVGDIMFIEPGNILNVDCLFIEGHNLLCDESAATGESKPAKKTTDKHGDCVIISGSKVLQGVAKLLVISVGVNSYYGRAMILMRNSKQETTPLQYKLNVLADQIAKFGFIAAGLMFIILILKVLLLGYMNDEIISWADFSNQVIGIVIQAITIIVVAVPEGLPMAVTLALAFATTEMLKDNNLVRHLSACETMGNVTAVCSDKTGTLTENKMTIVSANIAETPFLKCSELTRWISQVNPFSLKLLMENISINSTAFEGKDAEGIMKFIGSSTECSMIDLASKLGYDYQDQRACSKVMNVYPFSSMVKSMTTIVKINEGHAMSTEKSLYRIHTKGAAEIVLEACTHYVDIHGHVVPLNDCSKREQEIVIKSYAERSLRTIALAYRDIDSSTFESFDLETAPLHNLVLVGVIGIQDQIRSGVIESVQEFRRAGVFIRMITGDNIETAKAIAKECGILTAGGIAMSGPDFRALSVEEQKKIIPRLQVLARSSPIDKTTVVSRLQERREVVAMTGDGTNDGPALKLANIGFAMGIAGTEVAKEASDIILMDDNFNSILQALKWGRAVNDGVKKFLTFQLTVNIAAVVLSFVSALMSGKSESVLNAVQLLWVNMIMDTFAALALATEPLTDELVKRKPLKKDSHLINWRMSRMIVGQAIFQIVINLLLIFYGAELFGLSNSENDVKILHTMVFNTFVFLQVFNELNCRRIDDRINILRGITKDHLFIIIQTFVIIGQIMIVQYGGIAFKTEPLNLSQWIITMGIGSLSILTGTLIRLLPKKMAFFWSENNEDEFNHEVSYNRLRWEYIVHRIMQDIQDKKKHQGIEQLSIESILDKK